MSTAPVPLQGRHLLWLATGLLALQLLGGDPSSMLLWGAAALVLLGGLKLRESRRPADLRRVVLCQLITVGTLSLEQISLSWALVQACTVLVILAGLLDQESGGSIPLQQLLGRSLKLLAVSLPGLMLLFLLLPRLGPLWSLQRNSASQGRTGLSDRLDPGSVGSLIDDSSPALRLDPLYGGLPSPPQRYWRVRVLPRFDGRRWSASPLPPPQPRRLAAPAPAELGPRQLWQVEPSPLRTLPWGGIGQPTNPEVWINPQGELVGPWAASQRRFYLLALGPQRPLATGHPGGPWQRQRPTPIDLALARGDNPRLEALGATWRALAPQGRIEAARQLFRQGFRYSLTPGQLPNRAPLDTFLFERRLGFCEHYASAFTALMRAAGLPARVVVGYRGGTWVPARPWGPGYLEVLQSDAHAWSEVWLEGMGWQRVDPTAWVGGDGADQTPALRRWQWLGELERSWARLDLAWIRWVVSFDSANQQGLLQRWLGPWLRWQGLLLLGSMGLATAILLPFLRPGRRRGDGPDRQRRRLERYLARLGPWGLVPQPGETLQAFSRRVEDAMPDLGPSLAQLGDCYLALRFGSKPTQRQAQAGWDAAEQELAAAIRRLPLPPVERDDS